MTSSLTCALRTALEAKRKLVVPDTLCCHPLHCGRKRCEPTLNFFSLNGGNVLLESQVSTRGPVVLPCTQNLSSWNQTSVLQRPRDCKRYWFQACENGTSKVRNQTWQPWTPPGNNSQWIQASVTRLKREAAAANATVTCLHVRRTDKMGRDYPCSVRDLTPLNIRRTLRTYYPALQSLSVIPDEQNIEYIHTFNAALSGNVHPVSTPSAGSSPAALVPPPVQGAHSPFSTRSFSRHLLKTHAPGGPSLESNPSVRDFTVSQVSAPVNIPVVSALSAKVQPERSW